jgi:hypothetical protein
MKAAGYSVKTLLEDLDLTCLFNRKQDVVTAFEIFEHLESIYHFKRNKVRQTFISIPMRLWFSPAYRSKTDMWDRHYHEFEDWQLVGFWKTGWKIIDRQKWTNPVNKMGIRPLLRRLTNGYYIVYAERIK